MFAMDFVRILLISSILSGDESVPKSGAALSNKYFISDCSLGGSRSYRDFLVEISIRFIHRSILEV